MSPVMSSFFSVNNLFNYLLQIIGTSVVCEALSVLNCSGLTGIEYKSKSCEDD